MSQTPRNGIDADSVDPGIPLTPLEELEEETAADFYARVRSRINRRTLASQSVDLSFISLFELFKDYLEMICQAILGPPEKKDD